MLYNHFTEELLGLQGVKVTNVEKEDNNIIIYLEMERKKSQLSLLRYRHRNNTRLQTAENKRYSFIRKKCCFKTPKKTIPLSALR